jgi:hypothetical protein
MLSTLETSSCISAYATSRLIGCEPPLTALRVVISIVSSVTTAHRVYVGVPLKSRRLL